MQGQDGIYGGKSTYESKALNIFFLKRARKDRSIMSQHFGQRGNQQTSKNRVTQMLWSQAYTPGRVLSSDVGSMCHPMHAHTHSCNKPEIQAATATGLGRAIRYVGPSGGYAEHFLRFQSTAPCPLQGSQLRINTGLVKVTGPLQQDTRLSRDPTSLLCSPPKASPILLLQLLAF